MPRFTYIPSFSSLAARAAICSRVSGIASGPHRALLDPLLVVRSLEDALHVHRRDVDGVGIELADFDQVLDLGDGDSCRGAHHRREVPRRLAEYQVAPLVALPGADDRVIGLERLLEDHLAPVDDAALLALCDLRACSGRSEEAAQAGASRADALRQRALRIQLNFELAAEELPLEFLVLADVARDHLAHLARLQEHSQPLVGRSAVVRDDREVLDSFAVDRGDQVLRIPAQPEPARHDHRAFLHVADRLVRVLDDFIHGYSRSTIRAIPSPPPMHSEAMPRFFPRSFIA